MLKKVYESHEKWINTVLKMGATQYEAEDIVGEMYLIIGQMLNKGLNISYGDSGVNYYYIYRTLKTNYLQMQLKKNKLPKTSIDLVLDLQSGEYIDYEKQNDIVEEELKNHLLNCLLFLLFQNLVLA